MAMRLDQHRLRAIKTFLKLHAIKPCRKPDYLHHLAKIASRVTTRMGKMRMAKMQMVKTVATAVTVARIAIQVVGNVTVVVAVAAKNK
jgi:hypothetical protein